MSEASSFGQGSCYRITPPRIRFTAFANFDPPSRGGWELVRTSTSGRLRSGLLRDQALELERAVRKRIVLGFQQKGIEPTGAVHRAQRVHADAELHLLPQRVAGERHRLKIGPEHPLRLVVGVADMVADHGPLAGQFTAARHAGSPKERLS